MKEENGAILKLDKMPTSCRECPVFRNCKLYHFSNDKTRHPQCTLQYTTELLETFKDLMQSVIPEATACSDWKEDYNKLYKFLGGESKCLDI